MDMSGTKMYRLRVNLKVLIYAIPDVIPECEGKWFTILFGYYMYVPDGFSTSYGDVTTQIVIHFSHKHFCKCVIYGNGAK